MKRIFSVLFLIILLFSFLFLSVFAAQARKEGKITYLLAGMDGAASNTDFLALASFDKETQTLVFLQIPRDTFISDKGESLKINQMYPRALAGESKAQKQAAMQALVSKVEELAGVPISGYAAISMNDFASVIDALGGVDINLPFPLTFGQGSDALSLDSGVHHLNGDLALRFVRYRKGYAMGDLGRMDVQKLFLAGLMQKCSQPLTAEACAALASRLYKNVLTDKSLPAVLADVMQWFACAKTANVCFATFPGAPYKGANGAWYYVINQAGAEELLSRFFSEKNTFDANKAFFDPKDTQMAQIYSAPAYPVRVYTAQELKKLTIIPKNE
ncbi:MAG: LCP family protein [Clostridia bacterium]|nr:LCP family protein [Clostridia bacterium]